MLVFRLIAPVLLAVLLWWGLGRLRRKYDMSPAQFNWLLGIAVLFMVVLTLIALGRVPVQTLAAPFIALLTFALRYLPWLLRLLPVLRGLGNSAGGGDKAVRAATVMSEEEALAILDLEPGAGRDEILAAHRRLMQKLHPDHGGSGYLAQRLNEARDLLLERRQGR